jgi:predicted MFS family arabinose efflux permease
MSAGAGMMRAMSIPPVLSIPPMPSSPPQLGPDFRKLAGANLAAQAAEQLALAATPIVAVVALGAGPGEVGLLAAAQSLPFLLLAIPLGLAADRHSRRSLMMGAEWLRAASLVLLLISTLGDRLSIGLLALLGFLGAAGTVAFSVAAPALVPALVPHAELARANGRLELARSLAFAGGPALAGALVGSAGAGATFTLATMLSVAAAIGLWRLREPAQSAVAAPPRHPWMDLREGALLVWQHRLLRPILLTAVVWNLSWFVLQAAFVPHAVRALGLEPAGVGLTLACAGVGMVLGALAAGRVLAALPYGISIILGPMFSLTAAALMAATVFWPEPILAGVSLFLFGFGPIIWTITSTTLRQTVTPMPVLGRVSALFLTANTGARPIGAALGGAAGAWGGEATALWLALAGFALQAVLIAASPVRTLAVLPARVTS